ncbi:MAG: glutamine--fructose-6-phosphate transaminase (isomerizing), partial [Cellvibrionales bacterium]|nr:glutamine--fructose-6-phosphate transaminase (isomerizing) [Cellvibrionales bacterium]
PLSGPTGLAHTRWATHGPPTAENAHPHCAGPIALVHNGIIENHQKLRAELADQGCQFASQTDSEVIAHLLHRALESTPDLLTALQKTLARLTGTYALCALSRQHPGQLIAARHGSPLVIGIGIGENFIASDPLALRPVTDRFIFLEDGDCALITPTRIEIHDRHGQPIKRQPSQLRDDPAAAEKAPFRHHMLKEIHEQPTVVRRATADRLAPGATLAALGPTAPQLAQDLQAITLTACGTSHHACLIAKHWIEHHLEIPAAVEIASEYRYRKVIVPPGSLYISLSQSGETADTLAALRKSHKLPYLARLAICNRTASALVRESDHALLTAAGPEIGVASTKAFTAQLVALLLLIADLARARGATTDLPQQTHQALRQLPTILTALLDLNAPIQALSHHFAAKQHALFLGRGIQYPVAKEGALKLKEISYIHAEAYPAGELKHGPLALVDSQMPVIAVAPTDQTLAKITANLEEVRARGGQLYVFADQAAGFKGDANTTVIAMPHVAGIIAPIVYTLPLQLLAYHVAIVKGTDVDQPRNLAKSVTVE